MKRKSALVLFVMMLLVLGRHSAQGEMCRPAKPATDCKRLDSTSLPPWNDAYLEGQGLELQYFALPSGTTFPPAPTASPLTSTTSCGPSQPVSVNIAQCTAEARGMAICSVDVVGSVRMCGHGKDDTKPNGVIMVKGFWDGRGKWSPGAPGTVTLSCAAGAVNGQLPRFDGAITSCIALGYYPEPNHDQFLACIRAVRADYCGDGQPRTLAGTLLEVHDPDVNPMTGDMCGDFNLQSEATWSPDGAVCVYHDRWTGQGMGAADGCQNFLPLQTRGARCRASDKPALLTTRSQCNQCPLTPNANPICADADQEAICPIRAAGSSVKRKVGKSK